ncbi:LemA family protein [Oligosphaera ethanolica]|jgi:LemA protein|uniref:LemA protein n=1 Tax=Oligosphaera ethanolica TaxID=760260 RepID=A0AAE4ANJ4_9BACT|nr:LemA family protein [Oligosphaera ethanolica]MDQ0288973.1 LemA protein [Oligosphaera ethanolica]
MGGIIFIILVIAVIMLVAMYNGLVRKKKLVDNAWSQIDVQLKRRYDLIPNLVESVKGYAAHEAGLLEKVTLARTRAMGVPSGDTGAKIAAETELGGALRGLMVQVEAYPQLKANENFLQLQEELTSTENKIAFSRQHYNDSATNYNTAIAVFPANVVAGMFKFQDAALWQITEAAEREAPKVKF